MKAMTDGSKPYTSPFLAAARKARASGSCPSLASCVPQEVLLACPLPHRPPRLDQSSTEVASGTRSP
jgi:hypothetical protein